MKKHIGRGGTGTRKKFPKKKKAAKAAKAAPARKWRVYAVRGRGVWEVRAQDPRGNVRILQTYRGDGAKIRMAATTLARYLQGHPEAIVP